MIAIAMGEGIILTAAGILLAPAILRAMGTPGEVFGQAVTYLQVYFGGILFSVIYNMSAGILNAVGNSKRSLLYLMIAAISNIFLDLLFVVALKMGIVGAALATDRVLWIWGALAVSHEIFQVMVAYPLSWVVGALLILLYAWKGKWMQSSLPVR